MTYLLITALFLMADPNRTSKLFPYGHCAICDGKIIFPGLDGSKCAECGWFKNSEIEMLLRKRARELKKAHTASSNSLRKTEEISSPVSKPRISLAEAGDSS